MVAACFRTVLEPCISIIDDVAGGWLINMTEVGSVFVQEMLTGEVEEVGETKINLATCDLSSVLVCFK